MIIASCSPIFDKAAAEWIEFVVCGGSAECTSKECLAAFDLVAFAFQSFVDVAAVADDLRKLRTER